MKTTLNQNLVLRLNLHEKPTAIDNGKLIFKNNTTLQPYIIFDDHRDAPTGFGVKISKTKKTYLIQRRVSSTKVIKAKVGNVSDFTNIDAARNKSREMVNIANNTMPNPNSVTREKHANEITLSEAFSDYRVHLLGKPKPAKQNTLLVLDKALKRLQEWHNKKLKDISSKEILAKFDSIANPHRTAAEQTFRWAFAATNYAIQMEEHNAASQGREASLSYNPFLTLKTNKKFRSRNELEESYRAKAIRNPLTKVSMSNWLAEIVKRRPSNRTGCDYLLLTTLWGTRKSESLTLKWLDKINATEALTSSWIDIKNRIVHFYDTKNRNDFDLPIADAAFEILTQRYEILKDVRLSHQKWVFPAISKNSKTGHYCDMKLLIKNICIDANISPIGVHDLRRTFGRFAEELTSYTVVKKLLNHQTLSDVTSRYTDIDPNRLLEAMQRIELHILQTTPSVYNLLLTPKYPPIPTVVHKNESIVVESQSDS